MTRFIFIFVVSFFIVSCQPKDLPTEFKADKDESYARISHLTTQKELQVMQKDLKNVGITFDYSKSTYLEDGKIKTLQLIVILDDGTGGKVSADLMSLQYHYYGFEYNRTKQLKFKTGSLN
jgi:hypothetical protein